MADLPDELLEGGLWCHQVLEHLDGYVEGNLDDHAQAAVETHLRACDRCARFGGSYGQVVQSLRDALGAAPPVGSSVARRLTERLGEETKS